MAEASQGGDAIPAWWPPKHFARAKARLLYKTPRSTNLPSTDILLDRNASMPSGTVKFFNPAKGFGFISPEDGGADIFVHVSAVERSGLHGLNDGDQVAFEIERDRKTGKAAAIDLKMLAAASPQGRASSNFSPRDRRGPPPVERGRPAGQSAGSGRGVVKWFNPAKGFGFIQPAEGGGDVFVHISAVEQAGLNGLNEGQPIAYELEQDRRSGKTSATNLRLG